VITQQLLDFIVTEKQKGLTEDEIHQTLLQSNWSEVDIKQAFDSLKNGIPAPTIPQNPQQDTNKALIVIVCLILFYPVGVFLMWKWMKQWAIWVKLLLSATAILVIIAIAAILFAAIIAALHPFRANSTTTQTSLQPL